MQYSSTPVVRKQQQQQQMTALVQSQHASYISSAADLRNISCQSAPNFCKVFPLTAIILSTSTGT